MVSTTDHSAITEALERFNIKPEDYYLMFDSDANAIYIVWCTTWSNALRLTGSQIYVEFDINNSQEWQSREDFPPLDPSITSPLVCVRYILEAN
jgi:hypothetical protein